jgi:hypothetical protein
MVAVSRFFRSEHFDMVIIRGVHLRETCSHLPSWEMSFAVGHPREREAVS